MSKLNGNDELKRGNLLWESSRMMLPEHKEALLERNRKQKELPPPLLGEDQLVELNHVILQSVDHDLAVTITYATREYPKQFWGWITKVDPQQRFIKIINDKDILTVKFEFILNVELTGL